MLELFAEGTHAWAFYLVLSDGKEHDIKVLASMLPAFEECWKYSKAQMKLGPIFSDMNKVLSDHKLAIRPGRIKRTYALVNLADDDEE